MKCLLTALPVEYHLFDIVDIVGINKFFILFQKFNDIEILG